MKLQEIRALLEKVTPGPWFCAGDKTYTEIFARQAEVMGDVPMLFQHPEVSLRYDPVLKGKLHGGIYDAEFITRCRTLVPLLLDVAVAAKVLVNESSFFYGDLKQAISRLEEKS